MPKPLPTDPGPDRGRGRQANVKSMSNAQMSKLLSCSFVILALDFIWNLNFDIQLNVHHSSLRSLHTKLSTSDKT